MFFDAHADIWTDITHCRSKNINNRLRSFHYPRMQQAGMAGGIFVVWVDPPYDTEPQKRTLTSLKYMQAELYACSDIITVVKNYSDFAAAQSAGKLAVVIGMEGLAAIGEDTDWLYALHALGVRHASLTWNEENALATGVRGTPTRGLTAAGKNTLAVMEAIGMVVDVSHANEKTFWDIYESTTKPLIASHSNCMQLCNNRRNLSDAQLEAIAKRNGVVGLNAYSPFIHNDHAKRNIRGLLDNVDHMVAIMGIDHVSFGFDFGDYLNPETLLHFQEGDTYVADGMGSVEDVPALLTAMQRHGYSAGDIQKMCIDNMQRVLRHILPA